MPAYKFVSDYGDADVPLLQRVVERGEEVELTAEQEKQLQAKTSGNWESVEKKSATKKASD